MFTIRAGNYKADSAPVMVKWRRKKESGDGPERGDAMETETRIKLLQAVDFFTPFTGEELTELLNYGQIKKYASHEYVIHEDAVDSSFFVILRGKVMIIKESDTKRRKVKIANLAEGEVIGEMAMLLDGHRSASVMAASECCVFAADGQAIGRLSCEIQLKFIRQVAKFMAVKLKKQSKALVEAF